MFTATIEKKIFIILNLDERVIDLITTHLHILIKIKIEKNAITINQFAFNTHSHSSICVVNPISVEGLFHFKTNSF